jgi:hypothetical protein
LSLGVRGVPRREAEEKYEMESAIDVPDPTVVNIPIPSFSDFRRLGPPREEMEDDLPTVNIYLPPERARQRIREPKIPRQEIAKLEREVVDFYGEEILTGRPRISKIPTIPTASITPESRLPKEEEELSEELSEEEKEVERKVEPDPSDKWYDIGEGEEEGAYIAFSPALIPKGKGKDKMTYGEVVDSLRTSGNPIVQRVYREMSDKFRTKSSRQSKPSLIPHLNLVLRKIMKKRQRGEGKRAKRKTQFGTGSQKLSGGYNREWFERQKEEARIAAEQKKYWDRIRHQNKMKRLKEERKRKDEEGAKKTREAVRKRKEEQVKVRFTSDTPTEGSGRKTVSDRILEMDYKKKRKQTNGRINRAESIKRGRDILKSYGIK